MKKFEELLTDIFRIIGTILSVFALYSIVLEVMHIGTAGQLGQQIGQWTTQIFGISGSILVVIGFLAYIFYFSRRYSFLQTLKYTTGIGLLLMAVNPVIAMYYKVEYGAKFFQYSGLIGHFFIDKNGLDLEKYISFFGIWLVSTGLFITSFLFIFDLTLGQILNIISGKVEDQYANLKEKSAALKKKKPEKKNDFVRLKDKISIASTDQEDEEDEEDKDHEQINTPIQKENISLEKISIEKPEPAKKNVTNDNHNIQVEKFKGVKYAQKGKLIKKRTPYPYPSLELLSDPPSDIYYMEKDEVKNLSQRIEKIFQDFNIDVKVVRVSQGPVVTCFEIKPAEGTKINKIESLEKELALELKKADKVRIVAPLANRGTIGIEVPNIKRNPVTLKETLGSDDFKKTKGLLKVVLGKTIEGKPFFANLAKMPHLLIAGRTGSGKSVGINTIIASLLYTQSPEDVKMLMIDPKRVELGIYNDIPHLLAPVIYYPSKAAKALEWLTSIMHERNDLFAQLSVRNIQKYNEYLASGKINKNKYGEELKKMSYIIVIIDELADLMMAGKKEIEAGIQRLAQMGRSVGIHLIVATQRPSVDVITGIIKANIPSRIAFAVASTVDSRTILDQGGAEHLLGYGDMLFLTTGISKPIRVQGAFISDEEVENIVASLKPFKALETPEQQIDFNTMPEKEEENPKKSDNKKTAGTQQNLMEDDLFDEAVRVVLDNKSASISLVQRTLGVGFNRAGRLLLAMEQAGLVGKCEGSKARTILVSKEEYYAHQSAQSNHDI